MRIRKGSNFIAVALFVPIASNRTNVGILQCLFLAVVCLPHNILGSNVQKSSYTRKSLPLLTGLRRSVYRRRGGEYEFADELV
jgi:hypothetical protein